MRDIFIIKFSKFIVIINSSFLLVFKKDDPGEKYVEYLIKEASSVPLINLPDDAELPSYYDADLFKK